MGAAFITAVTTVTVAITPRWLESRDRIRHRYSNATALLAEWIELPYRIARRTSDKPDVLATLAEVGHDLQERTARIRSEMAADHGPLGVVYGRALETIRKRAGTSANDAWDRSPVSGGAEMRIGSIVQEQTALEHLITAWSCVGSYRLLPYRLFFVLPESLRGAGEWNRYARLSSILRELENLEANSSSHSRSETVTGKP